MSPRLYLAATLSDRPAGIDSQSVIPESPNRKQLPLVQVQLHYRLNYAQIGVYIAYVSLAS